MKLTISKDLQIPIEAVTQTFSQIGRKGAGKTYLATMIAEQMLDAHAQVIAIDPVGNWWGLRVAADGHSKGKDIFVIGGEHGDVPLVPEAGARIGRLLVEKRISAVLDVSGFRQGERKRFAMEFAEEFFHLKKTQRSPVHIFIEEAQLFIPQRVGPDEARMVGAWESVIRLGRNYGIGASLVTQRPQSVNKEVLSQVECLFVLQVNGTHERKALEEWVQEAGADRDLVGLLPGLARGVGFVWSPSWLRMFKQVHFAKKVTFDASATPEVGREAKAAQLSKMDVEAIRNDLTEVVKAAEQDDAKALRRQIRELERQLAERPTEKPQTIEVSILKDAHIGSLEKVAAELSEAGNVAKETSRALVEMISRAAQMMKGQPQPLRRSSASNLMPDPAPMGPPPIRPHNMTSAEMGLPRSERLILTALAQYPEGRTKVQVAILTGYSVNSGGFNNSLAKLRSADLIAGYGGTLKIQPEGFVRLGSFDPLPTGRELLSHWLGRLPKCERAILEACAYAYPESVSKSWLAEKTSYSENSGGFNNALSRLRTLELITRGSEIKSSDDLF